MKVHRLLEAMELLLGHSKVPDQDLSGQVRDEIRDLVPEYVEEVFKIANLSGIEQRLTSARRFDKSGLQSIIQVIKKYKPKEYKLRFKDDQERIIEPDRLIKEVEDAIALLAEKGEKWNPLEVLLRVELALDRELSDLMAAFPSESKVFSEVVNVLLPILRNIPKDDLLLMWSRLLNLFKDHEHRNGLKAYSEIIPDEFFQQDRDYEKIRERIALFSAKYKPLIIRRMIQDGFTLFPAGFPGVAKIATLQAGGQVYQINNLDILVIRLTSQIVAAWEKIAYREKGDLAKSIGANGNGIIFDGDYYHDFKGKLSNSKELARPSDLLLMMKRLLKYAEEYQSTQSDVAQVLWQYKLGQEIIAPDQTKEIKSGKVNELKLQKRLSKYLIELGILSFGRTFGRSQIDLYIKEFGEEFVIETKVYKTVPSEAKIKSHVVQLRSYMDQITQPKGVLVIYNCSDTLIVAPRKWLSGRIWVMAINICNAPPNKRGTSIELLESTDGSELVFVRKQSPKKAAKKRK